MRKYRFYLGTLLVGLFLGWFLFGNLSSTNTVHEHTEIANKNERWTCSMHPQILREAPGDCPICGMDLIPAETGADGLLADHLSLLRMQWHWQIFKRLL